MSEHQFAASLRMLGSSFTTVTQLLLRGNRQAFPNQCQSIRTALEAVTHAMSMCYYVVYHSMIQ